MHACPDCGAPCDCGNDWEDLEHDAPDSCTHACKEEDEP
jgi:hypothetical protein